MTATAEARIYDAGWHFVLCAPSKRPIWRGWNRLRPTADVAALHRAERMAQSGSCRGVCTARRSTWITVTRVRCLSNSQRGRISPSRRGRHAYYDDDEPRANTDVGGARVSR